MHLQNIFIKLLLVLIAVAEIVYAKKSCHGRHLFGNNGKTLLKTCPVGTKCSLKRHRFRCHRVRHTVYTPVQVPSQKIQQTTQKGQDSRPVTSVGGKSGSASLSFEGPGGMGACGETYGPSDFKVAVTNDILQNKQMCGRNIKITYRGNSVTAKIVDLSQWSSTNVDVPHAVMSTLGLPDDGRYPISWELV